MASLATERDGRAARVALVYPSPFGTEGIFGGGERYAVELARALARRCATRLVTFTERPARLMRDGYEWHGVPAIRHWRDHPSNPWSLAFLASLRGADVIHCLCWNSLAADLATAWGHLLGKPVCVTDVGGGAARTLQRVLPTSRWVARWLLIAAAGGGGLLAFRERWRIILAGVDVEKYRPAAPGDRRTVVFVGRLLPHKGINYLIDAMPDDIPLAVIGRPYDDRYFAFLRQRAAGKRVEFVLDASDEEVIGRLQAARVAVLPSVEHTIYGDYTALPELLGFAAMEAMACGVPAICTRVGALHELVEDGVSGFLVPPNDAAALGARIRELFTDQGLADRMGRAARARIVEHFTWDAVAARCLAAYGEVLRP